MIIDTTNQKVEELKKELMLKLDDYKDVCADPNSTEAEILNAFDRVEAAVDIGLRKAINAGLEQASAIVFKKDD